METQKSQKDFEFDEMLLLNHDANHAKELAEQDLKSYENNLDMMRQNRIQDIQNQKVEVENRVSR